MRATVEGMGDMALHYQLIDGAKTVNINDLPEEAWRVISGTYGENKDRKLAQSVAFLYRCIDVRANAIAGLPWAIERGDDEVWTSKDSAPPAELQALRNLPDLLAQTEAELCFGSQAFWQQQRRGRRLALVRWLMSATMKPLWDGDAGLTGFERHIPGRDPFFMPTDDVVWVWLRGEHETRPRTPPAAAAMSAAGVLYNMDQFVASYFERGAVKATLLAIPSATPEAERKRVRAWWNRFMTGMRNSWGNAVINADAITSTVVGEGIGELSNNDLTAEKRTDIATALGVPSSLVMANAANYATAQQDELNFYNLTVLPEATRIARQLNVQLFEPLGLTFGFRPEEMTIYQADENERAAAIKMYVDAGMKLSIAAEILGVDLPADMEYADLDPEEPDPAEMPPPVTMPVIDDAERQAEMRRLRAWARKRKSPDVAQFASTVLSDSEKRAIVEGMEAATVADPFRLAWHGYP
jgi:phage portal protein BeeE